MERPDELGGDAVVRLRAAHGAARARARCATSSTASRAASRPRSTRRRETTTWWRATFPVVEPGRPLPLAARRRRRRLRVAERARPRPARASRTPTTSSSRPARRRPAWHAASVVYEIFPDRFATSGLDVDAPPDWAIRARGTSCRPGAAADAGASGSAATCAGSRSTSTTSRRSARTLIYLTPIFPAGSTHRYDATTFDRVDPLLGGDEALALARARRAGARACAWSAT